MIYTWRRCEFVERENNFAPPFRTNRISNNKQIQFVCMCVVMISATWNEKIKKQDRNIIKIGTIQSPLTFWVNFWWLWRVLAATQGCPCPCLWAWCRVQLGPLLGGSKEACTLHNHTTIPSMLPPQPIHKNRFNQIDPLAMVPSELFGKFMIYKPIFFVSCLNAFLTLYLCIYTWTRPSSYILFILNRKNNVEFYYKLHHCLELWII